MKILGGLARLIVLDEWVAVFAVTSMALTGSLASARDFGPYVSGGLSKNMATIDQPGVNASLAGWGNAVEFGFDLPLGDSAGFTLGAELGQTEVRNNAQSSTYLDDTKLNSKAARGSFFYKGIYLGGAYKQAGVDLATISTTQGSSSAHVDVTGSSFFAGYAITYKNLLRASLEGETTHYGSAGFTYTDYSVGLKFQFVFAGLFDRSSN